MLKISEMNFELNANSLIVVISLIRCLYSLKSFSFAVEITIYFSVIFCLLSHV